MPKNRKPESVDDYLAGWPDEQRAALRKLRQFIQKTVPEAVECIAYQMPAFRLKGRLLVAFGGAAKHCSFFPMSAATIRDHQAELQDFDTSKGTIRFQPNHPIPAKLLRRLIKARVEEHAARAKSPVRKTNG